MLEFSPIGMVEHAAARWRWPAALFLLAAAIWPCARAQAAAEVSSPAPIPLEVNKLEPLPAPAAAPGPGCRVYLVVTNLDAEPVAQLRLDLILFGVDGVIAQRVALDLAPLPPHKTAVRLFDLPGQACDGLGRLLVNDVLACQIGGPHPGAPTAVAADQPRQSCLDRLQLSSRAKVELAK